MLNAMRKNLKKLSWVLWLVIATFVGTIFAVWGMGGGGQSANEKNIVAWVEDSPVSAQEFYEARNRIRRFYQEMYKDKFSEFEDRLQLSETALSQIIQVHALIKAAQTLGITISVEDVKQYIAKQPLFQLDGVFKKDRYDRVLKYSHMTESDYLRQVKADLARERVQTLLEDSVWISDAELKIQYQLENEKVRLAYIEADNKYFADKVEPDEESLAAFFEEKKGDYQIPDKVAVNYLVIDPANKSISDKLSKEIVILDEEIEDYYFEHEDKYRQQKEVKASHILIKAESTDPEKEAAARRKAEDILAKVNGGEDFAELAKTYSEDPGSAPTGGDLGFFPRQGKMVEPFAEAAFNLEVGEVSDVVKTQFGFHIIKVNDVKEEKLQSIDSVSDTIRKQLHDERLLKLLAEETERIRNRFEPDTGIEGLAKRFDLQVSETELFAARDIIPTLGWAPDFSDAAFALQEGEISPVVKERDKYYLMTLKEKAAAHQATLEEVNDRVKNDFIQAQALKAAHEKIQEVQQRIIAGEAFSSFADGEILKLGDTGLFTRKQSIKGIGRDEELSNIVFQSEVGSLLPPKETRNTYFLIKIEEHLQPDWTKFDSEKVALRDRLMKNKGSSYFNQWLTNLKDNMEITRNPSFFQTISASDEG